MTSQDHREPPVRVALAGGTGYGMVHRRNLARLAACGRTELVAVADPAGRPDDLDDATAWYPSLDGLLAAEDCDLVIVATPIQTHAALTEIALHAGKRVYLEKPPVASMAQFDRIVDLLERTGLSCQVGFQSLGSHALDRIAELIEGGAIGTPRLVTGYGVWSRTAGYFGRSPWSGRRRLGDAVVSDGVATNALAHAVAQALRMAGVVDAGRIETISTELYKANPDNESDDTCWIGVQADGALPVSLALTLCGPGDDQPPTVSVIGETGRLDLQYTNDRLTIDGGEGTVETEVLDRSDLTENLLDHLAGDAALLSPFSGHRPYMSVLEAIQSHEPLTLREGVTVVGSGQQSHPVITDIERYARQAAETGLGFAAVGAPWATSRAFRRVSVQED